MIKVSCFISEVWRIFAPLTLRGFRQPFGAVDLNQISTIVDSGGLAVHGVFRVDYREFLRSLFFLSFGMQQVESIIHVIMLMAYDQAKYSIWLYIFTIAI